jgi:hypothetical protein
VSPAFPPGVYKHASIEDTNRLTERWEREAIQRAAAAGGRSTNRP